MKLRKMILDLREKLLNIELKQQMIKHNQRLKNMTIILISMERS